MKNRAEIEKYLSLAIASALEMRVRESGSASLLVSGGSTPVNLFQMLSNYNIAWECVTISLVDERMVSKNHEDLNEKLVRDHLLQNAAKKANFIPLVIDESDKDVNLKMVRGLTEKIKRPFTVVVLGMGGDGHTASLFPESTQLEKGMDLNNEQDLMLTEPVTAPYQRMTFTRKALLNTESLFLHCYGDNKKEVLDEAKKQEGFTPYPIAGFLNQKETQLEIYWAK